MNWQLWTVLGLLVLGALASFTGIDKPREPKTADLAIASFLYTSLLIVLLLWGLEVTL